MYNSPIKTIGVLTSGGDAPGMNAAIRAVVRTAVYYDRQVVGIYKGYDGLINSHYVPLDAQSVCSILHRGGTFLKSARSMEFKTAEGRKKAYTNLKKRELDALVVIGGDGSFTGAHIFHQEYGIPVIGIPGTIDNDLTGTDFTIGYDTACNTATEAIDKIRDTASSHERLFFIEVMGRDAGFIAINAGISGGAISTIIPESTISLDELITNIGQSTKNNYLTSLVIVAEGGPLGGAYQVAEMVKPLLPQYDIRVTILGHLQRGGAPSSFDRVLASRLGVSAVEALLEGKTDVMAGSVNRCISYTPLEIAIQGGKPLDIEEFRIASILSSSRKPH